MRAWWAVMVCVGCASEAPRFAPSEQRPVVCGAAGQACCEADATSPDGGPVPRCAPSLVCRPLDALPDAAPRCRACPPGLIACDGACIDPSGDAHCGACGNACAPGQECVASHSDAGTQAGFACRIDCSRQPGTLRCDARCVDPRTDVDHCGRCDQRCALAHADSRCDAGRCAVRACHAGFADCDADPANGCEVDLRGDADHCGACRNGCGFANALAVCEAGSCRWRTCREGFADCDADPANGCEVDLGNDVNHCGRCGFRCPRTMNALPICHRATCWIDA